MSKKEEVNYWDYLKVPQLLELQGGINGDADQVSEDELHFIIVHQVFELWFKLTLRELRLARDKMCAPHVDEEDIPYVVHHLKRVNTILRLAAEHFNLMETLTPQDFLEFRSKLGTASGFQSYQMREMEFLMGLELQEREAHGHGNPAKYIIATAEKNPHGQEIIEQLNQAQKEQSLREALHDWLYRTPIHGSMPSHDGDSMVVKRFIEEYLSSIDYLNHRQLDLLVAEGGDQTQLEQQFNHNLQQAREFLYAQDVGEDKRYKTSRIRAAILFIESYRSLPLLAWPRLLIDTIVEMEEHLIGFRFRHARMVERIIGRRIGTGGSSGVDYLDQTLKYRIFSELWSVRTMLLPQDELPSLKHEHLYDFATKFD